LPARDRPADTGSRDPANVSVVIRCDGSPGIGLGHVVRCLALAQELRDRHARSVIFAMRTGPLGIGIVRRAGFPVVESPDGSTEGHVPWLHEVIRSGTAEILVLDSPDKLTLDDVRAIRGWTGVRVAVIDDASEVRLAADDAFYPPVPQVRALTWPDFAGRVHTGWEWVLLRSEFAAEPRRASNERPVMLVTMGGSDPAALTLKAMRALARVTGSIDCVVLLGPGFGHDAELGPLMESFPHTFRVVRDGDVREQMLAADLALLSFGVTAYEAAACGLPAVHLCLTDDHAMSSSAFAQGGLAVSLGRADQVEDTHLAAVVESVLADHAGRIDMGARARRLVDGNGAMRIARVIAAGGSG